MSVRSISRSILLTLIVAACSVAAAAPGALTFQDRVLAQEAIEEVYEAHRVRPDGEAPRKLSQDVLEDKVRDALLRSAALERYWGLPVTAEALQRELARIRRDTRFPDRLQEIFHALGDDPFLIQETFVRASLVERLTRNFFAYDQRIHGVARDEAADARAWMERGRFDPSRDDRWTVVELVRRADGAIGSGSRSRGGAMRMEVSADRFDRLRARAPERVGVIGPIDESRDGFSIHVVLDESPGVARIGTYTVPKRAWEDWWDEMGPVFETVPVDPVASPRADLSSLESLEVCQSAELWENGQLDDIPEPRIDHTAIWTGSEMVVWGGTGLIPVLATGGKYDPLTDSWIQTSTDGVPPARSQHTAVWTGSVMIVWAGTDSVNQLNDGGIYDPATNTWSPMSTVNAPQPRTGHVAVWADTEMIVWGGASGITGLTTGGRYDPFTDTWVATGGTNVPAPRQGAVAVWTGTEMVVWGGSAGGAVKSGGRYDPAADEWTPTQLFNAPQERYGHSGVWTGTEMIVWGGISGPDLLNSGGRYDPATDTWVTPNRVGAPIPRKDHTAVWTGDKMIIWGGAAGTNLKDGGIWDLGTDAWTPLPTLNAPNSRSLHTAVWTGDSMIVWGGTQSNGLDTSGGRYHLASNTWTPTSTPNGQIGRKDHSAVWTGSEMIVFGGYTSAAPNYLNTGGRYDPLLDFWSPTSVSGAPSGREAHLTAWTGTQMLIWGGYDGDADVDLSTGGLYDPVSDSWTTMTVTGAPSPRQFPSGVWTGQEFIVWGGFDTTYLGDGARYDPDLDLWVPVSNTNRPTQRLSHRAIWTGNRMIVWGGSTSLGPTNTGGLYDPQADSWQSMSTTGAASARTRHSAVWSGTEMIVYGGTNGTSYLQTGARYDPATNSWTPIASTGAPSARIGQTAVWGGSGMLVWGGWNQPTQEYFNTGARYDPVADSWGEITINDAPSARNEHTAVWVGDSMIIWGGSDGSVLNTGGRYSVSGLPGEATNLSLALDSETLLWNPASGTGVTHDVLRGPIAELPVGASASEVCLAEGIGTSTTDISVPLEGEGFWYLPRGENDCGVGTYGKDSSGFVRTSTTCP